MSVDTGNSRRGLVMGAGGVLGGSWAIGALHAWHLQTGLDPAGSDVIVGTSVGSLIAAMLSAGVSTKDLIEDQYERPTDGPLADARFDHDTIVDASVALRPGLGSPALLAQCVRHPFHQPPMAWCAALLSQGKGSLKSVRSLVDCVAPECTWPRGLGVVATNYDEGRRIRFDPGDADLADAVVASCSVPGYFPPVLVRGNRYVDGGVFSVTNADLLADSGVSEALVVAPMAAGSFDRPATAGVMLERAARLVFNRALRHEVRALERAGIRVTILAPDAEDLSAMGANLMDPRRKIEVLETALRTTERRLRNAEPSFVAEP